MFLGGRSSLSDGDWQNTPVADLLPVVLPTATGTFVRQQVPARPTALGYQSDWLRFASDDQTNQERWHALPDIGDYQRIGRVKPGAVTLLEALAGSEAIPLLVTQRYGRGKVMVLATGGTWRWQMQLPSEDDSHEVFWRQLLQEMVSETPRQVDFYTSESWYRDDPNIQMEARIRTPDFQPKADAEVRVTVVPEQGTPVNVVLEPVSGQPGLYRTQLGVELAGPVQLDMRASDAETELGTQRLFVDRSDATAEYFNAAQNRDLLERVAGQTGGRYWTLDNLAGLPEQIQFSAAGITERQWLPLWSMPINFILLVLLKGLEWILRRRWGHI
jgi:hypothetical protein